MSKIVKVVKDKSNGDITTWVSLEERGASEELYQFLTNAIRRIGNPTLFFTNAQLLKAVADSADEEIMLMKQATAHVVTEERNLL